MKKICYITTIAGSIKAFFIPQLQFLQKRGYQVSVISSPDRPELAEELGKEIRYIPIDIPRGISIIGMLRATINLKSHFKREKYNLIQYSTPNASFCAAIAGKLAGIPRRNYHLMGLRYLGANGLLKIILKMIEKTTCKLSTSIECVSKSNLKMAIEEGLFKPEKGTVVWNGTSGGVDIEKYDINKRDQYRRIIREQLLIGEDELVFGFAGRITRDKGAEELLQAFTKTQNAKLLMIGTIEQPLDMTLLDQAKSDNRIIFTGCVSDIEKYYCAMDVLILPSYREGFGMVIAEAAAMGTPAIVSSIPGPIDAIKPGITAITVEPRNITQLQDAMEMCIEGKFIADPFECSHFIKETFDSRELCQKIYERKEELLSE